MGEKVISKFEQFVIDRVRERRQELGISQRDLAYILDISEGFIGDVESTSRPSKWSLNMLNELAKALKCSPKDFLPNEPV